MAINPEALYPGKIKPSSASYPYGEARNVTTPGDGTGTPFDAALVNDELGFHQDLLSQAGIVPSGTPEKVGASQYLDAIRRLVTVRVTTYTGLKALRASSLSDGVVVQVSGRSSFTDGGGGLFVWSSANLFTQVSGDAQQGIYVAPDFDSTGNSGAFIRSFFTYLSPKAFGAVPGSGSEAQNSTAIQAYLNHAKVVVWDELYRVNTGMTAGTQVLDMFGFSMENTGLVSTDAATDVLTVQTNADHFNPREFRVEHNPVSTTKDGLVLAGTNDTSEIKRVLGVGHRVSIAANNVQFVLKMVGCRANTCSSYGFTVNEGGSAGLTSIVLDQCYATGCGRHSLVRNSAEVLYLQPIMDITSVSLGMIEVLGCRVVNIINQHAEGTSGTSIGDLVKIGGSATQVVNIDGLHNSVDASAASGPWRVVYANFIDNAKVRLDGLDSLSATNFSRTRVDVSLGALTEFNFYPNNVYGSATLDEAGSVAGEVKYNDYVLQDGAIAWGVFNGTTGALIAGHNVTGVTRTAVGRYTVNLSVTLKNANYAVVDGYQSASLTASETQDILNPTTTDFQMRHQSGGVAADSSRISFAVYGGMN